MNIGRKYKFIITDADKARTEMRKWFGQCDINIAQVIADGFIAMYSYHPEQTAARIGASKWEVAE